MSQEEENVVLLSPPALFSCGNLPRPRCTDFPGMHRVGRRAATNLILPPLRDVLQWREPLSGNGAKLFERDVPGLKETISKLNLEGSRAFPASGPQHRSEKKFFTAVPYIFEIVIFVLLFELALIVFLNYPFPVFPFR